MPSRKSEKNPTPRLSDFAIVTSLSVLIQFPVSCPSSSTIQRGKILGHDTPIQLFKFIGRATL